MQEFETILRAMTQSVSNETVRTAVAALGQWLVAISRPRPAESDGLAPVEEVPSVERVLQLAGAAQQVRVRDEGLSDATPGRPIAPSVESDALHAPARPLRDWWTDLRHVVPARARLKATACRWVREREQRLADGADWQAQIMPRQRELIAAARELPGCYLWMLDPFHGVPAGSDEEMLAGSYECLASSAELLLGVMDHEDQVAPSPFETALALLAESTSALRVALQDLSSKSDDDVDVAFTCLREVTQQRQIYVHRHMRLNDPADPKDWFERQQRIEAVRTRFDQQLGQARGRHLLLNKVRYHATRLAASVARTNGKVEFDHDWARVVQTSQELVDAGCPPSNRDLLELLVPLAEHLPDHDDYPRAFQTVLRELDHFLAARDALAVPDAALPVAINPDVLRVRELLRGSNILLIGGDRRPQTQTKIKEAFELADLHWIETRAHESVASFEPHVAHQTTGLVLLAIRWSSHSFGEVRQLCERYEKLFVRLPGGYGPNQIAQQILNQVGRQLEAAPRPITAAS